MDKPPGIQNIQKIREKLYAVFIPVRRYFIDKSPSEDYNIIKPKE
jgi:hypothetical protein